MSPRTAAKVRVLEERVAESEASVQALLSDQIDAVFNAGSRTPVLLAKAQEALCRSEERLRHERDRAQRYLDTAQVILVTTDLDGRITLINQYGCDLLGRTESELLGRDWITTCVPLRLQAELREKFRHGFACDLANVDNPILSKSGVEYVIEWRNAAVHDDAGDIVGMFSCGSDVTERTRAAGALGVAEERMRFALDAARVGVWDVDSATGALAWSPILEAQYGLLPGTFPGTFEAFMERIHPDDREATVAAIRAAMASGDDFRVAHRAVWPDGTVRWLNGAGRLMLDAQKQPIRAVGISIDVTERHVLEEQYHQAQKMEAIGRLAGSVAHDFNNLLTQILGYCELLLADMGPGDARQADVIEIQKAGASAERLTRQMLAFTRKGIVELVVLDVNAIVTGMRILVERLLGEDVIVVIDLAPGVTAVKADRGQVEQIVMNLAVNARDAMPRGGTLTIRTANAGPDVTLAVSDTGTGITPDVRARLFEPFFTTKDVGRGTGLGLATVHRVVTDGGGRIEVHTEVGIGTTFTVVLPRASAAALTPGAAVTPSSPQSGNATVLVVEDLAGLRALTRRLLEKQGYTVWTAANASEASRLFAEHGDISVLLTDVVMPGICGPQLTEELMARRPALKVVYMSGYTEETIVHHGVTAGIAFLQKPFTSEALVRKIHEATGGASACS